MTKSSTNPTPAISVEALYARAPVSAGYAACLAAAVSHGVLLCLRRRRTLLAVALVFVPPVIPIAAALLAPPTAPIDGWDTLVLLLDKGQISLLAPLLSIFFAATLAGELVDGRALPYLLTRPNPRSAMVLGYFISFWLVGAVLLLTSMALTTAAAAPLPNFTMGGELVRLLGGFAVTGLLALAAYGAVALLFGMTTKRPLIYTLILFYGWETVANIMPGLLDRFTIIRYLEALQPATAAPREMAGGYDDVWDLQREIYAVETSTALLTLALITAGGLFVCVTMLRHREFARERAVG